MDQAIQKEDEVSGNRVKVIVGIFVVLVIIFLITIAIIYAFSTNSNETSTPTSFSLSENTLPIDDVIDTNQDDGANLGGIPNDVKPADEKIELNKVCGVESSPVKFNIPSDWDCQIGDVGTEDDYQIEMKTSTGNGVSIISSNLGRGGPCDSYGEDGEVTECDQTIFYDNEYISLITYYMKDENSGGEIFGSYKEGKQHLGYVSISHSNNSININHLSAKEQKTIKAILDSTVIQ